MVLKYELQQDPTAMADGYKPEMTLKVNCYAKHFREVALLCMKTEPV